MTAQEAREEFIKLVQDYTVDSAALLRVKVAEATADAHCELTEARAKSLMPKDAQWNDLDRRTMMDGFVAQKEREFELLLALGEILADFTKARPLVAVDLVPSPLDTD